MKVKAGTAVDYSAETMLALLGERFEPPAYALLSNVRNATGATSRERYADALVMSLWPSRGLELHGFEIKAYRSDWIRERKDPAKAEEIASRCDRWWVVAPNDAMVPLAELPTPWGLLVPEESKGRVALVTKREASKLDAAPLDRGFLAAILRRTAEASVPRHSLTQAVEAEVQKRVELADGRHAIARERAEHQVKHLEASIRNFEEASGVLIDDWRSRQIGAAVKLVMEGGLAKQQEKLGALAAQARFYADGIEQVLADMAIEEAVR